MKKFHTASIVVWREHAVTKEPEFMVMQYQWTRPETEQLTKEETRFVSGTNKGYPNESPEETAIRKLLDESGLSCSKMKLVATEPLGRLNTKYGFLVKLADCQGEMRRTALIREGDAMSHPYWMSEAELAVAIAPAHRWLYDAACEELGILCSR